MDLLVVGTGALACLFAARLAGHGNQVTMLGRWQAGVAAPPQPGGGEWAMEKFLKKASGRQEWRWASPCLAPGCSSRVTFNSPAPEKSSSELTPGWMS